MLMVIYMGYVMGQNNKHATLPRTAIVTFVTIAVVTGWVREGYGRAG